MQEKYPEFVERYLVFENGKYKIISHKPDRRIMYTEDAWIYQSMIEVGVDSLGQDLLNESDKMSDRNIGNPARMTYFGKPEFKAHLNKGRLVAGIKESYLIRQGSRILFTERMQVTSHFIVTKSLR